MKLRYKVLTGFGITFVLAMISLAAVLGYTESCNPLSGYSVSTEKMKAITYRCYGPSEVLEYGNVEKPVPADDEVLIKIHAASINPMDWHYMRGSPYIMRLMSGIGAPSSNKIGTDFAGTIEAIGSKVTLYSIGDEVFGGGNGTFAQYITIRENRALFLKPANVSFEQAAAVPIAAISALQALRDEGKLKKGQKVLVNGASGGVGTYAVQIAKAYGATVHGVCSARNIDMVRSIGADRVFDYKKEDYTKSGEVYDLIIDNISNHSPFENIRVLKPKGILVNVGGAKGDWIGPVIAPIRAMFVDPFVSQELPSLMATMKKEDLAVLAKLMETGKMTSIIDKRYSLKEVPAAIEYSESGRARGKIVINIE
ncbi:MAG: NADPH:quinone reductase-like Zn-dependent oxidoreductase [Oceanicoccus sp.]|jgi:NADPH:quinone reductase-like Zn-dependent oxidoreductase